MPPGRRSPPEADVNAMGMFTWGLHERPKVEGHRGAGYAAPPNSMEAMIRASQMNLDSIEFDVWQLRCGTLIVAHGPEFLAPGDVGLRKFTLQQLEQEEDEDFSLFSEVIRFCKKKNMAMNIEIKGDDATVADRVLEELRALDAVRMASISAFEHAILERVQELAADVKVGVLHDPYSIYSDNPKFMPSKKQPLRKDFATYVARVGDSINLGVEAVTPEVVRKAHKHGVKVMAWFPCVPQVPEADENLLAYERLLRAGVDVICANYPQRLQEYLDARFLSGYATSASEVSSSPSSSSVCVKPEDTPSSRASWSPSTDVPSASSDSESKYSVSPESNGYPERGSPTFLTKPSTES